MFNANYQHTIKDKTRKITKEEIHKKANLDYERFEFLGDMLIKFFLGVDFCIFNTKEGERMKGRDEARDEESVIFDGLKTSTSQR